MAQNQTLSLPADVWTQITNADATIVTFQNVGQVNITVMGTTGATAPTDTNDGIVYVPESGESTKTLAELFRGITAVRVYARPVSGVGAVFVSHA